MAVAVTPRFRRRVGEAMVALAATVEDEDLRSAWLELGCDLVDLADDEDRIFDELTAEPPGGIVADLDAAIADGLAELRDGDELGDSDGL